MGVQPREGFGVRSPRDEDDNDDDTYMTPSRFSAVLGLTKRLWIGNTQGFEREILF